MLIRKGRRGSELHPKCVFRLAAPAVCKLCMVPTMENIQKSGVELGVGTQVSAATTLNAKQPVVEIAYSYDDGASSSEGSE